MYRNPHGWRTFGATLRLLACILLWQSAIATAQEPPRATSAGGVLAGVVLRMDTSAAPIIGAEVAIRALGVSATTDSAGAFVLANIPRGDHTVEVRALGHAPATHPFSWTAGERHTHSFRLAPALPAVLSPVAVTASRLRGFEERRALGRGHFLTEHVFAKNPSKRVADVLARVPGLRIVRGASGAAYVANSRGNITMRGANPACYAHAYVDDMPVFNSAAERFRSSTTREPQGLFDVNTLASREIIGVEYYAGGASIPPHYNRTGSACGVLLIWTRR